MTRNIDEAGPAICIYAARRYLPLCISFRGPQTQKFVQPRISGKYRRLDQPSTVLSHRAGQRNAFAFVYGSIVFA